jgi:hypothetical protein
MAPEAGKEGVQSELLSLGRIDFVQTICKEDDAIVSLKR